MTDDRVRYTFRVPTKLMGHIKDEAERMGVSLNALILQILWNWAKENAS